MGEPWYVVVSTDGPTFVLGPYATEQEADDVANSDDGVVYALLTIDAKSEEYIADDVVWTQEPPTDASVVRITPTGA